MLRTLPTSLRLALVLVVMTMLLARGWMGQAMAMDMAMTSPAPVALHAGHDAPAKAAPGHAGHDRAAADSPPPCHGSTDTVAAHDAPAPAEAASHCGTCTLCQVCHSVAMTDAAAGRPAFALPQVAPTSAAPRFASAEPKPGFKPPIS